MRHAGLLAVISFFLSAAASAQPATKPAPPAWQDTPSGQMILRPFESAPYPHASRADGFKGKTTTFPRDPHYVDSTVAVVIPSGYVPGDAVNYVVHFHGHMTHLPRAFERMKLPEQLVEAKVNAILIAPQGPKDAADSGCGKLELDKGGFAKLIVEVTKFLNDEGKIRTSNVDKIVLSAHSGGYKVTAAVLTLGGVGDRVSDVLLLDASYGSLEAFPAWAAAFPDRRLVSLFTEHLADENKALMGLYDQRKIAFEQLDEATLSDDQLRQKRPLFIPSQATHNDVPVRYFGRLLKTSSLPAIGPK